MNKNNGFLVVLRGSFSLITALALVLNIASPTIAIAHGGDDGDDKVNICHNTGSESNPWNAMQVDQSSLAGHLNTGDFLYNGSVGHDGKPDNSHNNADNWCQNNVPAPTPTNNPPVSADDVYSMSENTSLDISALGVLTNDTDADGDTLSSILVSGVSNGTLTFNSDGSFTYTPSADFTGTDSFTYKANDGTADGNTATVTITVNPADETPVANDDAYSTAQDTALNVDAPGVLSNDVESDGDMTASLVSDVSNGTLTLNSDGSFSYNPNGGFFGSDSFTYTADDSGNVSNIATATITVNQAGIVCDEGTHLSEGECVSDEVVPPTCDIGFHLADNECVPDESNPPVCTEGQHLENNVCVNDTSTTTDTTTDSNNNNSGGGGGGGIPGGHRHDISGGGQVLGISIGPDSSECSDPYLTDYLHVGNNNDPEQVKKLQQFLNAYLQIDLPVTGTFGQMTYDAVLKFQAMNEAAILTPWANAGLPTGPTGYVYKTTQRWINILKCPTLITTTPVPTLP